MSTLSFLGCVNIAVRIVRAEDMWPAAELWEVRGIAKDGNPAHDIKEISQLRVFFAVPRGTVTIISTAWGQFEQPLFHSSSFTGDVVINWPVKLDLSEARDLMVKAGYNDPFTEVMLRYPLSHPPQMEASYIFVIEKFKRFLFVGVDSHEVHEVIV